MSILCGVCGERHGSVQEVRECSSRHNGGLTDVEAEAAAVRRHIVVSEGLDKSITFGPAEHDPWEGATESEPGVWSPGPAAYLEQRRNPAQPYIPPVQEQGGFGGPTADEIRQKQWDEMLKEITEGFYALSEDEIYQVVRSKAGRLYAKLLVETQSGSTWEYAAGAILKLKPKMRMDLDKVAKYGKETGRCLVCGRELTNPESIEAGIGPVCASRF